MKSTTARTRFPLTWIRWLLLPLIMGMAALPLYAQTDQQEVEIAISASFANLADSLLLLDASRHTVRLLVTGSAETFGQIDTATISCRLDLAGLTAGTHTITVQPTHIQLPKGIVLQRLLTPTVTAQLVPLATKHVGVIVTFSGQAAPGFAVTTISSEPARVVLQGPAEALAGLNTVRTSIIALDGAAESFKKEVPIELPDNLMVTPTPGIVVAQIDIGERIITRVIEDIPVVGKGTTARHTIQPQRLTLVVSGPEPILNVMAINPDFAVTIDLAGLPAGKHTLTASIQLPVETILVAAKPERFTVTIQP